MIHTIRYAFVALPLVLLLAGCSGNSRTDIRPASAAMLSARTTGQPAAGGVDPRIAAGNANPVKRPAEQVADAVTPEPRYDITLDQIREHVRNGEAVIIDARGPADYAIGHVRGALNMPAGQKEAYMVQLSQSVAPGQFIIIYCNGPNCNSGDMVYEYLVPQGFTNMRVFKPGWEVIASVTDLQ